MTTARRFGPAILTSIAYGFLPLEAVEGQSDVRPAPTPMFLSMRAIEGAIGARHAQDE